jgi:asparaginyl-tRNA synthetase
MMLPGIGDCFCIEESFRAEDSHTRRHLTEFTHGEAEWGGIMKFDDHLDKLRSLLEGTLRHFLKFAEKILKELDAYERVSKLYEMTQDIMVLEHKDAIKMCREFGIYKDEKTQEHFGERDDIPEAQERQLIGLVRLCS